MGCLSAWHRKGPIDNILYSTMVFVSEIPPFLIGILFLFYLAAQQGLFPLSGGMTPFADYATWMERLLDIVHHGLPALTLPLFRWRFSSLPEQHDHCDEQGLHDNCQAKGIGTARILFRQSLSNAACPLSPGCSIYSQAAEAQYWLKMFLTPRLGALDAAGGTVRIIHDSNILTVTLFVLIMNSAADIIYKRLIQDSLTDRCFTY